MKLRAGGVAAGLLGLLALLGLAPVACASGEDEARAGLPTSEEGGSTVLDGGTVGKDGATSGEEEEDGGTTKKDGAPTSSGKHRIFATHNQYNGNLGGIPGADGYCDEAAKGAQLGGIWKAWISDGNQSAASRVGTGPFYLLDGTTIAFPGTTMSGKPDHDLDVDEFGATGVKGQVWTGSSQGGTSTGSNCGNWLTTGVDATVGLPHNVDKWADDASGSPCSLAARIYCVEQ